MTKRKRKQITNGTRAIESSNSHHEPSHDRKNCDQCRYNNDVQIPDHLIEQLVDGKLVVFAGAGISTEDRRVHNSTFYDEVHYELKLPLEERPSFPKLMSLYCEQPDGRKRLLERLYKRFQYIDSFPELYDLATRFHTELSTLFYVDTIVTTNWDDYFERECGATPMVTAQDFAFFDAPDRKVLKLHGSINNIGSIIATEEDYQKAQESLHLGALGSLFKTFLATRTILYVGYSLMDSDFLAIHNYIRTELGNFAPYSYIVTIDKQSKDKYEERGLHPIFTDGAYFLDLLKKQLLRYDHLLPDTRFDGVNAALFRIRREHERLYDEYDLHTRPAIMYCACYQDGLLHALERITARRKTGEYSDRRRVAHKIHSYETLRKVHISRKKYTDVAYIEGYLNGLLWLVADDKTRAELPLYYVFGVGEVSTFKLYQKALKRHEGEHKAALRLAKRIASELTTGQVLHHSPYL